MAYLIRDDLRQHWIREIMRLILRRYEMNVRIYGEESFIRHALGQLGLAGLLMEIEMGIHEARGRRSCTTSSWRRCLWGCLLVVAGMSGA